MNEEKGIDMLAYIREHTKPMTREEMAIFMSDQAFINGVWIDSLGIHIPESWGKNE